VILVRQVLQKNKNQMSNLKQLSLVFINDLCNVIILTCAPPIFEMGFALCEPLQSIKMCILSAVQKLLVLKILRFESLRCFSLEKF